MMDRDPPTLRLRTVFISDIHLGFKGCSADLLLDFLHHVEMDTLFLVGDIIDVWNMQKSIVLAAVAQQCSAHYFGQSQAWNQSDFCPRQPRRSVPGIRRRRLWQPRDSSRVHSSRRRRQENAHSAWR